MTTSLRGAQKHVRTEKALTSWSASRTNTKCQWYITDLVIILTVSADGAGADDGDDDSNKDHYVLTMC